MVGTDANAKMGLEQQFDKVGKCQQQWGFQPGKASKKEVDQLQKDRKNEWTSRTKEFENVDHFNTLLNRQASSAPEPEHFQVPTYTAVSEDYGGISLLQVMYKVLERIILERLAKHRGGTTRNEQAGFRPAPSGGPLTYLEYADDVDMFTERNTKLQHVVNLVSKLAANYGRRLRPDKRKQM
ncbi:hypothetical protein RB195_000902 [Necator americanus]|uniref:Reverse transcriptase domain-containing protein n=1 Tax=Necator americanus TaxID=51031 RepID=A0ABR1DBU5_NECAM